MNEAETRAEHIDPALAAAGWGQVEGSRVLREHNITVGRLQGAGKRAGANVADNVLVYRNTKLAVIEAKAWAKPLTEGVGQAKSYATTLAIRHTYATNGQGNYCIDMHMGAEGEVALYPTPDELWGMAFGESLHRHLRCLFALSKNIFPNKSTPPKAISITQLLPSLLQPLHTHRLRRAQLLREEAHTQFFQ